MGAGAHSELAWALHWAILLPLVYAISTEELPAIIALFGLSENFEADAAEELVPEFLVHEAVLDSVKVVAAWVLVGF